MKTFNELGLSHTFVANLFKKSITNPTEIQEKAIPLVLAGKDILAGSATGSGKTLVFASPLVEKLEPNNAIQALILTPTRELAEQISESIKKFSEGKKLRVLPIYGGVNIDNQIRRIGRTDVIVGTPGRILDHMNRRTLNLTGVKYLILDEVDRMFDMGFYRDVEKIIGECPKDRQTMLFSATISEDVFHLAKNYTKNPIKVSAEDHIDASKLKQIYYNAEARDKFSLLVHLLKKEKSDRVLVFCSTRRNVDFITDNLIKQRIQAKCIHGGIDQKKRIRTLNEFHDKKFRILVCTDVAARGLDIKGVSHVYNYDLPKTSGEYIHRIGRTARAGENGEAINLVCNKDYENFSNIEKDKKLKIALVDTPSFERLWVDAKAFARKRRPSYSRQRDSSRGKPPQRGRSFGGSSRPRRSFGGRRISQANPRFNSRGRKSRRR